MKLIFFVLLFSLMACNTKKETPAPESTSVSSAEQHGILPGDLPDEDCDDKAKKKVEITEESISLNNGDTGCSLDEMSEAQK
jgi:hypothetical protein